MTRPRWILLLALFAALAWPTWWLLSGRPAGYQVVLPPLRVEPPSLRLPPIPFGKGAAGEFVLTNEGDEPLVITGIGPSGCDCAELSLTLPARPRAEQRPRLSPSGMQLALQPGEEARLRVVLSTARYREPVSWKGNAVPIRFASYDFLRLEYSADILIPFWVEPWAVQLGEVGIRERPIGAVVVKGDAAEDLRILAPAEIDGWRIELEQLTEAPPAWRIEVQAPPELPAQPFHQEFVLHTSVPDMPVRFTVFGVGMPDLAFAPSRVTLQPDATGRARAAIEFRYRAAGRRLERFEATARLDAGVELPARLAVVEEGRAWVVEVELPPGVDPAARDGVLVVRSDDPDSPELRVPILVFRG